MPVAVGQLQTSTAALGNTVSVTSLPFDPSAVKSLVLFWLSSRTSNGQSEGDHNFGGGYAISATDRGGCASQSDHNAASMATDSQTFSDACFKTLETNGTVDGAMDFDAWLSNGFRLIIDNAFPEDYTVNWMVISGWDYLESMTVSRLLASGTGSQDYNTLSFDGLAPQLALFYQSSGATINTSAPYSNASFGVVDADLVNAVLAGASVDGAPDSITMSYNYQGECLAIMGSDTVTQRGAVTAFNANGLTINWLEVAGANPLARVVCGRGFGGQFKVGDILSQTGTSNVTESGLPFDPVGLIALSHNKDASTQDTAQTTDERSIGFATVVAGPTVVQNYASVLDKDASGNADVGRAQNSTGFYGNQSTAGTIAVEGVAGLVSFGTGAFTFVHSDADPAQAFIQYLVIGAGGASTEATLSVTEENDSGAITAALAIAAAVSQTEQGDSAALEAALAIAAVLAQAEADDLGALTAALGIGALGEEDQLGDEPDLDEENDTLVATATVGAPGISADLSQTEENDSGVLSAALAIAAALAQAEQADTAGLSAALGIGTALSVTEDNDALGASGALGIGISVDVSEEGDTPSASAGLGSGAGGAPTEADDSPSLTAALGIAALLAQGEADDSLDSSVNTGQPRTAVLAQTEQDDNANITATVPQPAVEETPSTGVGGPVIRRLKPRRSSVFVDSPKPRIDLPPIRAVAIITEDDDTIDATAVVRWEGTVRRMRNRRQAIVDLLSG